MANLRRKMIVPSLVITLALANPGQSAAKCSID